MLLLKMVACFYSFKAGKKPRHLWFDPRYREVNRKMSQSKPRVEPLIKAKPLLPSIFDRCDGAGRGFPAFFSRSDKRCPFLDHAIAFGEGEAVKRGKATTVVVWNRWSEA